MEAPGHRERFREEVPDILGSQQEESWAVLGLWPEAHLEGER